MKQELIVHYLSKENTFVEDRSAGYRFRWDTWGHRGVLTVSQFDRKGRKVWAKSYRTWISVEVLVTKDKRGKA